MPAMRDSAAREPVGTSGSAASVPEPVRDVDHGVGDIPARVSECGTLISAIPPHD